MKKITPLFLLIFFLSANAFGQWTTTNLSEAKEQMGSVVYGSKVYFGGGGGPNLILFDVLNVVEIYDLTTGEWTQEHLSIPRQFTAAGAVGGKVFFAGGINFLNFEHYSRVDIFDTLTQVWTTAELPEQKFDVAAVTYGDRVFFAGGVNLATGINSAAVDIYNTSTGEWTTALLSEPGAVRAVVSGTKLVFVGASSMDIYNTATATWTTENLPDARLFSGVAAVGNQILIAGGMHFDNTPSDRVDIYDLGTGAWTISNLSVPRGFINNAATACGKAFFVGGGTFDLNTNTWISATDWVDIFDPATGEWTTDHISHSVINHSVVAHGNQVLIAGGADPAPPYSDFSTVDIYTCGGVVSDVWEPQKLNYTGPHSSFSVSMVDENVAWTIGVTGDFSVTPWIAGSDFAQNDFAKTVDGGQTWTVGTYPNSGIGIPSNIAAFDENTAWIAYQDFANGPKILKTTDGGLTWIEQNHGITSWVGHVYFWNSVNGLALGDVANGSIEIYTTGAGGQIWVKVPAANMPSLLPGEVGPWIWAYAFSGSDVYFATSVSRVFHSSNKGYTWEVWPGPPPGRDSESIAAKEDGTVVIAFDEVPDTTTNDHRCQLWRTSDEGSNWTEVTPDDDAYAVQGLEYIPGTGVLIGSFRRNNATGPFKTQISYDDGDTWIVIDEGTKVFAFDFLDATTGYATEFHNNGDPSFIYRYKGEPLVNAITERKSQRDEISVNPNPTSGMVTLRFKEKITGDCLLTVSDIYGRIFQSKILENAGGNEQAVDLAGLPAGMYLLTLSNESGSYCSKVLKQ